MTALSFRNDDARLVEFLFSSFTSPFASFGFIAARSRGGLAAQFGDLFLPSLPTEDQGSGVLTSFFPFS